MKERDFSKDEREQMVKNQLRSRDINDPLVLEVMGKVPRHSFVDEEYANMAYSDGPLPIGKGQTISQPYIVALMTQLLELKGDEKILEVGTGSGYQAAVLAHLAREVHTIERHKELARNAERKFKTLGITNIVVHIGDGSQGLKEYAPYDGVLVTAAAPSLPAALKEQLIIGGRIIIPVGGRGGQFLECWTRTQHDFECRDIIPVAFVPLIGQDGWDG
jgi:protein-L-isoaspartate(D-aspartate) O-methyltransferase